MAREYPKNRRSRYDWNEEKEEFLRCNYLKGKEFCASVLGASNNQVASRLHKMRLNITSNPKAYSDVQTKFNHSHYLDFSKPSNCYLMGLFWADACLTVNNEERRFSLVLVKDDFDDIKWIFDESLDGWSIVDRHPKNRKIITQARCHNFTYLEFLESCNFKIKSGASAHKILSHIPGHLKHYWWRGYFDGDGWFSFQRGLKYGFGFSSVLDQEWDFCFKMAEEVSLTGCYLSKKKTIRGNSSEFLCSNFNDTQKFGKYIYQGYDEDMIGLSRKYNKFLDMKKTKEESQKYYLKYRV